MAVRARTSSAVSRRSRRHPWLPAVVLVAGLVVVWAIVRADGAVTADFLRSYRADHGTWKTGLWLLGQPSPFDPFVAGRLSATTIVLTAVYLASTAALGAPIVRALEGADRWPRPLALLAGFVPGYLMVLGPVQLVFATLPVRSAAWTALVGVPVSALLVHRRALSRAVRSPAPGAARRLALSGGVIVTVLSVAALHRLQAGQFFLVQDALQWFLLGRINQVLGAFGDHLAQWKQQSDEWVFNAPLMFYDFDAGDFELPLYATQFVGLASFCCLTFGLARTFARRRRAAAGAVTVAAVLGATTSIFPSEYVTIVGGDNPMLWTAEAGRLVGVVLPWVVVLLARRPLDRSARVAAALGLAGLGFTSLNLLALATLTLVACLVWQRALRRPSASPALVRGAAYGASVGPLLAVALIVCTFWRLQHASSADPVGWWLVAATAAALAAAASLLVVTRDHAVVPRPSVRTVVAAVALMGVGLVLANNLVADVLGGHVRGTLAAILPGYDSALITRPDLPDLYVGLHFPRFSPISCDQAPVQCSGLAGFLAAYGVLLVLALATWCALGPVVTADPRANGRRYVWLLMMALLAVGLTVVHFAGAKDQAMLFTRIIETPLYGLLALAAVTFAESRSRVTAYGGLGFLVVWTVVPLIGTRWPEQMTDNASWVLRHVGLS